MRTRAQTSLPALTVTMLVLASVTAVGLAMADGALAAADRDAGERQVATSLASRLVAPDGPLSERANVVNATKLSRLNRSQLLEWFPVVETVDGVEIRRDGTTVASTGVARAGTTVRRLVLVERHDSRTIRPDLEGQRAVTLPRRASAVTVTVAPPNGTVVVQVRANDRIVLRNTSGLAGTFTVALSRFETTTLRFAASGPLPEGSVTIRYEPPTTTKATLAVTVDA